LKVISLNQRQPKAARLATFTLLLAVVMACSNTAPPPTPDPRLDEVQQGLKAIQERFDRVEKEVGQLTEPTATPAPTATAVASPTPTPTPGVALGDVRDLVTDRIAAALTAIPRPILVPSIEQVERLIQARVTEALAAIPTPEFVPTPIAVSVTALVKVVPQVSGSAEASVQEGVELTIEPGLPLAGQDVRFILEGLDPWQGVTIEFVDPRGATVPWVTEDEVSYAPVNGAPVTNRTLYADGNGKVSWMRVGTKDAEGIWTVRITIGNKTTAVTYPVAQLQVPVQQVVTVDAELRRCQGVVSDTYFSAQVPTTLALDSQAHLAWVTAQINQRLGIQSTMIPDIYLLGNESLLKEVARTVGTNVGFEVGFHKRSGTNPGIDMRTDSYQSDLRRTLTHEYVHLVLDEITGHVDLPSWLNEGLAGYIEYELRLDSAKPHVTTSILYIRVDRARRPPPLTL